MLDRSRVRGSAEERRLTQRRYAGRAVVAGAADQGPDRAARGRSRRVRDEKGLQVADLAHWVEPEGALSRGDDHRHPVMDGADDLVRLGRQQADRLDALTAPLPQLPRARQREEVAPLDRA